MPSLLSNPNRPTPQQERAARTHQLFLDTAERLFVEVGYDAMTMTAVAERAGTSIGALYRWFPDKTAVAAALLARYTFEIEQHWSSLIAGAHTLTTPKFAELLIDRTREFSQRRPAYFILRDGRIKVSRSSAARKHLREAFVQAFRAKKPTLSHEEALLIANVVVETVKGFLSVIAAAPPNRRAPVTAEFTQMLSLYLEAKFR
jgi:AcrR family transcriptional regulator